MRKRALVAAALALIGAAPVHQAQAQTTTLCRGRVEIIWIMDRSPNVPRLREYSIGLRNRTPSRMEVTVTFSGFPSGAIVQVPVMLLQLSPQEQISRRFGGGLHRFEHGSYVASAYDSSGGSGPTATLTNCRAS